MVVSAQAASVRPGLFRVVAGVVLALVVLAPWAIDMMRPRPMLDRYASEPGRLVLLYPLALQLFAQPLVMVPVTCLATIGLLLVLRPWFAGLHGCVKGVVGMLLILAALAGPIVPNIDFYRPRYSHLGSSVSGGKLYHQMEVNYPVGPTFHVTFACDSSGLVCRGVSQAEDIR